MSGALTDLAGLNVTADDLLAGVLAAVSQRIWVVDREDVIRFANDAAVAALGYERSDELPGQPSHETTHHHRPDGTPYPAAECPVWLPRTTEQAPRR